MHVPNTLWRSGVYLECRVSKYKKWLEVRQTLSPLFGGGVWARDYARVAIVMVFIR